MTPTILSTRNYDMFKSLNINRPVRNVKRLVESLNTLNLQHCTPIVVTPDYRVLEGQHRLAACREMGIPVYYVVCDIPAEQVETAIILLNKNQKTWSVTDYINLHASKGIACYANFRDWYILHGFPVSVAMSIYSDSWLKAADFRAGKEFSKSENADAIADFLNSLYPRNIRFRHTKDFAYAARKAIEMYSPRQIKRLLERILQVGRAGNAQGYINQFNNLLGL